ncbi:MAG: SLC13/DASS family transporter [Verrucomicrobiales bacterium]|nr:SLC13/DASS family transporter [Verrucomicrobiales bacterium]
MSEIPSHATPTAGEENPAETPSRTKQIGLWLGLAAFVAFLAGPELSPDHPAVSRTAAVAALMAIWWITDAIPLAATSLLPLVLFPLLGILKGKDTAPIYINETIFLYVGGFMIALAMERWQLHKRIALSIIRLLGGSPPRLVLSFMLASALLSMWISNTATAIMMLAIGLAIVAEEERRFGRERTRPLSVSLLLGIAYGSSCGGMATLVGTPPNLSFVRIYEISFPHAPDSATIGFGQWMLLGVPVMLGMLLPIWFLLTRVFFPCPRDLVLSPAAIETEYQALGPVSPAERRVLAVFITTAILWVFREDLQLGAWSLPGWSRLLPESATGPDGKSLLDDGTVAIAMALLLFLIPSGTRQAGGGERLLTTSVFRSIPWDIVLLFGGGFALAKGFQVSGLAAYVGERFAILEGAPPLAVIAGVCGIMTFLTELTSNAATTEMALPILASIATAMNIHPLMLMIPATLSASCAFMLPVATPPNAIVFGSGRIRIADMAKVGLAINLIGIAFVTILFYTIGIWAFGIDPGAPPSWITPESPPTPPTGG